MGVKKQDTVPSHRQLNLGTKNNQQQNNYNHLTITRYLVFHQKAFELKQVSKKFYFLICTIFKLSALGKQVKVKKNL